ncbi:putative salivary secreted serine protease inhibitor [Anopheles sinensis]|uniref:Putative salivary secreted serine protease inhibitor n=1 Tax=Anopheles sinensis TaxID=74873 RepID=A0A084VDH6_ANOSI|nr:putative salivary secreted serine protease inhibitor [Anopheles sinensis]
MRAIYVILFLAIFVLVGVQSADDKKDDKKDDKNKKCGENETYQRCGTACERRCDNSDYWNTPCEEPCVDKCFCDDGYLRDKDTNKCVRAWRCGVSD